MKPQRPVLAALLLTALGAVLPAAAGVQDQPKPARPESARFDVPRATVPLKIDGVLDDEAWAAAPKIPLPFEWQPGDNVPAPVETECLVTYDLHNL
jgi:hypothetical protein